MVAATDDERRRIARDLHDGSQQRLAALGLNLSVVRELLKRSPDEAAEALTRLRSSVTEAQADLRALVHGIYPPALTEHGVVMALGSAASYGPNVVRMVADDVGRHPPDVEAAVYFCCTEALQNAAKHAGAGSDGAGDDRGGRAGLAAVRGGGRRVVASTRPPSRAAAASSACGTGSARSAGSCT